VRDLFHLVLIHQGRVWHTYVLGCQSGHFIVGQIVIWICLLSPYLVSIRYKLCLSDIPASNRVCQWNCVWLTSNSVIFILGREKTSFSMPTICHCWRLFFIDLASIDYIFIDCSNVNLTFEFFCYSCTENMNKNEMAVSATLVVRLLYLLIVSNIDFTW